MSITFSPEGNYEEGINMANGNAYAVMDLLKMETDCCGSIMSSELIRLIDDVKSVDSHVESLRIDQTPGHATMISCGRSEDYLWTRLNQLRDLAVANPGRITWG